MNTMKFINVRNTLVGDKVVQVAITQNKCAIDRLQMPERKPTRSQLCKLMRLSGFRAKNGCTK